MLVVSHLQRILNDNHFNSGRMSDQNQLVRLMATHSFATLVQLMPLDGGVPEPPSLLSSSLKDQRDKDRAFLKQLLSPSTIPDYVVPVPIEAELRSYQQVNYIIICVLTYSIVCTNICSAFIQINSYFLVRSKLVSVLKQIQTTRYIV